jgi:hypothetical protein
MRPLPQGNGSGKFEIFQTDMGGWVRVFPSKLEEAGRMTWLFTCPSP